MTNWRGWYYGYGVPVLTLLSVVIIARHPIPDGEQWTGFFGFFIPFLNWIPVILLGVLDSGETGVPQGLVFGILAFWTIVGFAFYSIADQTQEATANRRREEEAEKYGYVCVNC